jgi:hypothetical protein
MKRALAPITAMAILCCGAALASAATTTLKFTTVQTSDKQTSTGFSSTESVFQNGKKVGTDRLNCIFGRVRARCTVGLTITGKGTIKLRFTVTEGSSGGPLTIAGGTGTYEGATGTGSYRNLNNEGTRTAVTLKLQR